MEKKNFGKTNLEVSEVALGGIPLQRLTKNKAVYLIREIINSGINFIDTANAYHDSEEKIGEAIKIFKRDKLVISSKSGARDSKTFLSHLDLSLKRLGTDYLDIYHLHGVNNEDNFEKVMAPGGAYEVLEKAVASGKVRYCAFSSHNLETAKKIMLTNKFQVVQYPINFIDDEAEKELIPLARKLKVGFIAMKPMGGGMIEDAGLAFRYLSQFKEIIPDPGIEKLEEMEEIIDIVENSRPLTNSEKEEIKTIKKELGDKWCHMCDYCQPCPNGIMISMVLRTESFVKRFSVDSKLMDSFEQNIKNAEDCVECKECMEKCPYNLNIPELLKQKIEFWKNYKKNQPGK